MGTNQVIAGVISNNQDPDGYNRIRVYFPYLEGSRVSGWIPYEAPMTGDQTGSAVLPEVDTPVLVVSFDRYRTKMIALPCPYTEKHRPPKTEENSDADLNQDGRNSLHFFKSRSGYQIITDDTEGKEKILLVSPDKNTRIELDSENELITIKTDKDYSVSATGTVRITAEELEITAEKTLSAGGETVQLTVEKELEINGDKELTAKGTSVSLN
jgi:uncharacterized protein involved in type VI secretion and phage assembly